MKLFYYIKHFFTRYKELLVDVDILNNIIDYYESKYPDDKLSKVIREVRDE